MSAVRGPSRAVDTPVPGTYKFRLVKRGPWVGAEIRQLGPLWLCLVNGKPTSLPHRDINTIPCLFRVANYGMVVSVAEHAALLRKPHPSPDKPINLSSEKPIF